jgi:HEAT repeat protein
MKKAYDIDIVQVIGDFLEMGHLENIVAMFKQDTGLYSLVGHLLQDDRYAVRLGIAVLFEELALLRPAEISLAVPTLLPLLENNNPILRGEAATLLGIIGTKEALAPLRKLANDPDPAIREIVSDILQDTGALPPAVTNEYHP